MGRQRKRGDVAKEGYELDQPPTELVPITFCGKPAMTTGVVNLELLLGEGGHFLVQQLTDEETQGPIGTAHDGKAIYLNHERKGTSIHNDSVLFMTCDSDGLQDGCFSVKAGCMYWVAQENSSISPLPRFTVGYQLQEGVGCCLVEKTDEKQLSGKTDPNDQPLSSDSESGTRPRVSNETHRGSSDRTGRAIVTSSEKNAASSPDVMTCQSETHRGNDEMGSAEKNKVKGRRRQKEGRNHSSQEVKSHPNTVSSSAHLRQPSRHTSHNLSKEPSSGTLPESRGDSEGRGNSAHASVRLEDERGQWRKHARSESSERSLAEDNPPNKLPSDPTELEGARHCRQDKDGQAAPKTAFPCGGAAANDAAEVSRLKNNRSSKTGPLTNAIHRSPNHIIDGKCSDRFHASPTPIQLPSSASHVAGQITDISEPQVMQSTGMSVSSQPPYSPNSSVSTPPIKGSAPLRGPLSSASLQPLQSPALGFIQVHSTLAEEFSLNPSSGSSYVGSEYLYDDA